MRGYLAAALVLVFVGSLSGCITEDSGKGPKVATAEERLQAQLELARGYLEKREWARARPAIERALEISPRSSEAHVLMAHLYQEEGEKKLAEEEYKAALRADPSNAQALNNYGSLLYSIGRYADAHVHLTRAVRDTGYARRAQAYENLGFTELKLDDVDAAEGDFKRALSLDSTLPRANLELADLYFTRGIYPQSQQYYDAFLKLSRQSPRSLWLGIRLCRVFDKQDALASYALLLKNLYPGSDEYRLYRESIE